MIKHYFSLVKIEHTIFALPFALIGFYLGVIAHPQNFFSWYLFGGVLTCMLTTRTAAMAFNRYIDRKIDAANPRTANREIPAGIISARGALWLTILSSGAFIVSTYFINPICFYLSPIALLITLGYSYTKRFTWLCHFILGLGLALAPVGAYMAVTATITIVPILYGFIVLFWVSGFDLIYALQDESFDKINKLHSVPVLLGRKNTLILSAVLHTVVAILVVVAIYLTGNGITFYIGAGIFIGLLTYQHLIVSPSDISKINLAFFTLNGIASVIFAAFFILDYYLK